MLSHELGELAIETGISRSIRVEDGQVKYYARPKAIVEGRPQAGTRYLLNRAVPHFIGGGSRLLPGEGGRDVEKWEIRPWVRSGVWTRRMAALSAK